MAGEQQARSFLDLVSKELGVAGAPGLQALRRRHRGRVRCQEARRLTGSVDLDQGLRDRWPEAPRWDYGIGYLLPETGRPAAIWLEVHPAFPGEVAAVLKKLRWLRERLEQCPGLRRLTDRAERPYRWVASDRPRIPPHLPEARRLRQAGMDLPRTQVELP
ncbi:MAG: hypothetical protein D6809_00430 [Gammaproteobacteria bacterium]|nr:MAG: hypothetical protein D6809_00430 [Gammaproteobacteria bacterium]